MTPDTHTKPHVNRRTFLKGLGGIGVASLLPYSLQAADLDYDSIQFDPSLYESNNAQTIIVYLYGGPSELAGNLTNLNEINTLSQNPYPLNNMTPTTNYFWEEAGGDIMERLLSNNQMNIFRTCYRTVNDLKAHGECTTQAQKGKLGEGGAGIIANLASILHHKGVLTEPTGSDDIGKSIPFVTLEGESTFFSEDDLNMETFLKPVAFGTRSNNPYKRSGWISRRIINKENNTTLSDMMDDLAHTFNPEGKISEAFSKRALLEQFNEEINALELPAGVSYPENNSFADRLQVAIKLMIHNPHTKVVSVGSSGLGGWDDHSNALARYTDRMTDLMEALEAATEHIKDHPNINIVVFGEFGRNVNYNNSFGWDHGNNQNVYWLGGSDYMNHLGIVGETEVFGTGGSNRLYTRPKNFGQADASSHFQVFSIAATIYQMYGITNPEVLTEGNGIINGLLRS
jgi:hypothetical protein